MTCGREECIRAALHPPAVWQQEQATSCFEFHDGHRACRADD
jgi:hypothetical protein